VVWDRPYVRRRDRPHEFWSVYRDPLGTAVLGTAEGFTLIWVWSTLFTLRQHTLLREDKRVQSFLPQLIDIQRQLSIDWHPRLGISRLQLDLRKFTRNHVHDPRNVGHAGASSFCLKVCGWTSLLDFDYNHTTRCRRIDLTS
jgi:hypothetical protein